MQPKAVGLFLSVFLCAMGLSRVSAQTLLERFAQQFEVRPPSENLPPPREPAAVPLPQTPTLGVRVAPITDEAVRLHQLVVRRGALISAIEKGSPADRAGLPLGAVIVALDGRRVDSPEDLMQAARAARGNREVEVTYYERDKLGRKRIAWGGAEAPAQPAIPRNPPPAASEPLIPPPPTPNGSRPVPPLPSNAPIERQLGGGGSRPLLGRLGRILDGVIAPAQAVEPAVPWEVNRIEPETDVSVLRQQIEDLRRQVQTLQRQVDSLERKLDRPN